MKLKTYNNRLAESVWWNLLWLTIGAFFVTVCVKSVVASHAMLRAVSWAWPCWCSTIPAC